MKEYSSKGFKDLSFGNPAVVEEVRFQKSHYFHIHWRLEPNIVFHTDLNFDGK